MVMQVAPPVPEARETDIRPTVDGLHAFSQVQPALQKVVSVHTSQAHLRANGRGSPQMTPSRVIETALSAFFVLLLHSTDRLACFSLYEVVIRDCDHQSG